MGIQEIGLNSESIVYNQLIFTWFEGRNNIDILNIYTYIGVDNILDFRDYDRRIGFMTVGHKPDPDTPVAFLNYLKLPDLGHTVE